MPVAAATRRSGAFEFSSRAEDNAVGQAGTALRARVNDELGDAVRNSVFWTATILLNRAQTQLATLAELRSNWDTYGAPVPNQVALENGARVLERMTPIELSIVKIVPSAEGGVGFCFAVGNRYADIESSNEGDILGVKYVGTEMPALIETDGSDPSIDAALQQVR